MATIAFQPPALAGSSPARPHRIVMVAGVGGRVDRDDRDVGEILPFAQRKPRNPLGLLTRRRPERGAGCHICGSRSG